MARSIQPVFGRIRGRIALWGDIYMTGAVGKGCNQLRFIVLGVSVAIAAAGSFTCAAAAYTDTTLYTFCSQKHCPDGSYSEDIAMDQAGNLYGTTFGGGNGVTRGALGLGVAWEYVIATSQYQVIYTFCSQNNQTNCSDGSSPGLVKLVIDTAGNLYGTTIGGGNNKAGVVFELIRSGGSWSENILYSFCSSHDCQDGGVPEAGLTYAGAAAGQPYDGMSPLYGTTFVGGKRNYGVVFALSPNSGTWTESVLHSFCKPGCGDGASPKTPLYLDGSGNLYGTTEFGGQYKKGAVFEVSPNGSGYSESVLYNFCGQPKCADGEEPSAGVIGDTEGNLYGTADGGDKAQDGVIFELSPDGAQWQYNVLADFTGKNGTGPTNLILDAEGNLFGTASYGGKKDGGTVFEFNGAIETLYSFCSQHSCRDGKNPISGVVEDAAGDLFGTTLGLGSGEKKGVLFELTP
jgi:uncharacterized repeat protein (TIGR03803 family)